MQLQFFISPLQTAVTRLLTGNKGSFKSPFAYFYETICPDHSFPLGFPQCYAPPWKCDKQVRFMFGLLAMNVVVSKQVSWPGLLHSGFMTFQLTPKLDLMPLNWTRNNVLTLLRTETKKPVERNYVLRLHIGSQYLDGSEGLDVQYNSNSILYLCKHSL